MDSTKCDGTNDNTKKKCPFLDKGNENESIRKMPYKRWFGLWNMMQYMTEGHTYYERMDKEYNSTVYKVHFSEDQTVLNDHESVKICYDPEKVDKQAGLSFINYNPIMLRGYVPTMYLNGTEHEERKAAMMEYLSYIQESVSIDNIISMVEEEFKKMPSFKDLSDGKANEFDIEKVLSDAVENVVTKVLLGDTIDHDLIEKWSVGTSEFQYSFKLFSRSDERNVTDEMFKTVEATPNILNLGNIIKSSTLEKDVLIRQIVWMTMFNGAGSIRNLTISTLIALLQLSDEEKLIIAEESKSFLSSNNKDIATLSSLKTIHQLFIEVCRLFPPAPTVYRKPKDDYVIESTSGRFELEKGGLISGKLMGVHRDPKLYVNPKEISLNRAIDIIEENIYTLGGKFNDIPTPTNFKCPGQSFGIIITKIFMMYLTKSLIVPVSDLTYTGSNLLRLIGSDKPLKVKTFSYQE